MATDNSLSEINPVKTKLRTEVKKIVDLIDNGNQASLWEVYVIKIFLLY